MADALVFMLYFALYACNGFTHTVDGILQAIKSLLSADKGIAAAS